MTVKVCKNCTHSKTSWFCRTIECWHPKNQKIDPVDGCTVLLHSCSSMRNYFETQDNACNKAGDGYDDKRGA